MNSFTTFAIAALTATAVTAMPGRAAEERTMSVDRAELPYAEAGEGTPVVFIHGAISDARVWEGYADRVAETGRFVAYTQRYFGTADWPDDGELFTRETHIADLIAFVEGLGAGPVHLVTWSYSGEIATYAALQRPELFRSLVHYEPDVERLLEGLPGSSAAAADFRGRLGPAVSALQEGQLETAALRLIETVFAMPVGTAEDEPAPFPSYWRENGRTLPAFVNMAPGAPLSCDELGRLTVPTLVVAGTKTLVHFAMMAERLAQCSGNAILVRMDGVGHDGPYRRPERFLDLVLGFTALVEDH